MAIQRYRYKMTAAPGISAGKLQRETDSTASVFAVGQNPIVDIDIDDAFLTDLDESMATRGYTRIAGPGVTGTPNDVADFVRRTGDTMSGALDMGGNRIKNVPDSPVALTDAVNANYVQNAINARDPKDSVRLSTAGTDLIAAGWTPAGSGVGKTLTSPTNATTNNNFDSVAAVVNNRILVEGCAGANAFNNGIYVLTQAATGAVPAILTRSTDADQNADVTQGMFTFQEEGTLYNRYGWQLITADPIVVDTTLLTFATVAAADSITAGAGLKRTVNVLDVELDTAAAAQTAGSGGGSSGLEFDTAGAAGKLRAAVNATGGLQRSASGLAALLDAAGALATSGSGLAVAVDNTSVKIVANQLHATAGSTELTFGANAISSTTTSRFLFPGYADSLAQTTTIQYRVTRVGVLKLMRVHQNVPAGNGNAVVYTLRVNGVNSTLTASVNSNASDGSDLTHNVTVAIGDLVDIIVTKAASIGTTPNDIVVTVQFDNT